MSIIRSQYKCYHHSGLIFFAQTKDIVRSKVLCLAIQRKCNCSAIYVALGFPLYNNARLYRISFDDNNVSCRNSIPKFKFRDRESFSIYGMHMYSSFHTFLFVFYQVQFWEMASLWGEIDSSRCTKKVNAQGNLGDCVQLPKSVNVEAAPLFQPSSDLVPDSLV